MDTKQRLEKAVVKVNSRDEYYTLRGMYAGIGKPLLPSDYQDNVAYWEINNYGGLSTILQERVGPCKVIYNSPSDFISNRPAYVVKYIAGRQYTIKEAALVMAGINFTFAEVEGMYNFLKENGRLK